VSERWLGTTAPICAASPDPPVNAGTAGAAKTLAWRLKFRAESMAFFRPCRSFAS
jgi:hypothetical protein